MVSHELFLQLPIFGTFYCLHLFFWPLLSNAHGFLSANGWQRTLLSLSVLIWILFIYWRYRKLFTDTQKSLTPQGWWWDFFLNLSYTLHCCSAMGRLTQTGPRFLVRRMSYQISESTQSSIFILGKVGHESLLWTCCRSILKGRKGREKNGQKRTLSSYPGKKCSRKLKSYNCCCLSKTSWKRNGRQSPKETWDELWDPLLIFLFLCSSRELLSPSSAKY